MFTKGKMACLTASILGMLSLATQAAPNQTYVVVAPQCLIDNAKIPHQTVSRSDQISLIKINEVAFKQLMDVKHHQKTKCGGFINVTEVYNAQQIKSPVSSQAFLANYTKSQITKNVKTAPTYTVNYSKEVNQLLSQMNPQEMWSNLTTLSNFHDRYAASDNGVAAANWIKTQVEQMAKTNNRNDVTTYFVKTGAGIFYKQPSLVVKLGNGTGPGVVIGAHMDTLQGLWGPMPGADDDGTGTVTVLEVARTLLSSHIQFKKPIYLIWYSAEEEGLVGSQYVVADFKKKEIPVDAVIHMDMTGYANKNDPTMWLVNDYVNKDLMSYLETLINTYVKQPVKYTACGYACSDHATWTNNGFKAAIPFESEFGKDDPYIHTADDKMEVLSLSHMTDFAKLGIAFVVEMAEPI